VENSKEERGRKIVYKGPFSFEFLPCLWIYASPMLPVFHKRGKLEENSVDRAEDVAGRDEKVVHKKYRFRYHP